jgi:predicted enzyme related to lactoylglutathione lyase
MNAQFLNPPAGWLLRRGGLRAALASLLLAASSSLAGQGPELPPLTTVSGNPRLPGKFVWADLVTDDVKSAREFYSRMFGWTFLMAGDYTIAANDERPLCGLIQVAKPADRPQATPRWIGYISVANVSRAQSAITKAGGRVLAAPRNMPKRGEQALFADAEGAVFGVVKSSAGDPEDFMADPGDWIWIQLLSRDGKKAGEFYRAVGGYDVIENAETNRLSDFVLSSKGFARATIRTIPAGNTQTRPSWLPFVRVKNASESAAQAKQLGGKVLIEPSATLFDGKVAIVADPTGAAIGIMEWPEGILKGSR